MKTSLISSGLIVLGAICAPGAVQAQPVNCADGTNQPAQLDHPRHWGDENTSSSTYIQDSEITYGIRAALASSGSSDLRRVGVCTEGNGEVVLSGRVRDGKNIDRAVATARATQGVTSVRSAINGKGS